MNRKEFLTLLAGAFWGLQCKSRNYQSSLIPIISQQRVIIIGAGISGLQTAKTLFQSGLHNILILEAGRRWGGRILTDYEFADFPLELGAEEVHGEKTIFKALLDKYKVDFNTESGETDYYLYKNKISGEKEMEENIFFDSAMQLVENWSDYNFSDIPVTEILKKFPFHTDPEILNFLNAKLGNESGTDNSKLSAGVYAKYSTRNPSGYNDFTLKTGISEILKQEYRDIFPLIQFNQAVVKINYSEPTLKVHTQSGKVFEADQVIVTVPLGILKSSFIQFIPSLPLKKQEAIDKIGFEPGMKVILKFNKRFWPENMGSFFCKGIVPEYWAMGRGRGTNLYLTGFLMGESAGILSKQTIEGIKYEVTKQLDGAFGSKKASGNLEKILVKDWLKEEFTKGGYSSTIVGSDGAFEILGQSIQERIHFAGEATRSDGTHQTVHGAMLSGIEVARKILGKIIILFLVTFFSFLLNTKISGQEKLEINPEKLSDLKPDYSIFVDTYYAHSNLRYPDRARIYGTQIMNDKEFSLNHALINLEKDNQNFRYALGIHTGTYVQANYAHEPRELQYVYQAYAGIPILPNLWLDVGIFPSHIGGESAISMLNHNYTRSLIAENSPYYESGARLQYKPNEKLTLGIYALNGWQKIKDDNKDKAGGLEIVYEFNKNWTLSYSTFGGNEAPDFEPRQTRYFQDINLKGKITEKLEIYLAYDLGFQKKKSMSWTEVLDQPEIWTSNTPRDSFYRWQGFTLQFYYHFNEKWKIGGRGEGYLDRNEVIVQTGSKDGYQVYSGSINLDYIPISGAILRLEAKRISSLNAIFVQEDRDNSRTDNVIVANFAFRM
jgi:monoamine oxidase